jgi:hypothetical protein
MQAKIGEVLIRLYNKVIRLKRLILLENYNNKHYNNYN